MKIQWLEDGTKLRPLRDQIVVKALEWSPSTIITVAGSERRPMRGIVVAVGPGQRVKKYWRNSKGERCKMGETGQVIPTEVKPGDLVEVGGLELNGYQFPQVTIGSELHVVCQEQDVAMVIG
jgi:co-chaperonin GroES (HSP10)